MGNATGARRYGHAAARITAIVGGLLLAVSALISYFIAGYADDAVSAGTGAAEDALRGGETGLDERTSEEAADWVQRLADWAVSGRPDQFQTLALIATAAGVLAVLIALFRSPHALWPEIAWGVLAVAGLAPNLAFDLWFSIWIFTGSLIAGAAAIHYLARRDDHVKRAVAVSRRAGVAAKPHVNNALSAGYRAAGSAVARARGTGETPKAGAAVQPPPMPGAAPASVAAAEPPPVLEPGGSADPPPAAPAGWYADPREAGRLRYWDGAAWTSQVS
jgi:hypothetical protein